MFNKTLLSKAVLTTAATAALAVSVLPGMAQAQSRIQKRFHWQQSRINQGVRSGQLTQGEYRADETRLKADEYRRQRDLRQNGGPLTRQERINENRRLNRNSGDIYYTKHNRKDQPGV